MTDLGSTMFAIAPAIGLWQPQISLMLRKQWLKLDTSNGIVQLNKPLLQIAFNNSLSIPFGITLSIDMNYQSKGHYQNVYLTRNIYGLDLSVSKLFFNGALELNIKGSDLLYLRQDGNHLYGKRMEVIQNNRYDSREAGITLRYNYNASKSRYKGTGAGNSEKSRL